jgi:hypothetical protein
MSWLEFNTNTSTLKTARSSINSHLIVRGFRKLRLSTMKLDEAVIKLLNLNPEITSVSSAGGGGSSLASTSKISTKDGNGKPKHLFMKTGSGKDAQIMFQG